MEFRSRADIEALSQSRYFKARAPKVLEFAYELLLAPNGAQAMLATDFYKVVGNVSKPLGQFFRTFFIQSGRYTKKGATFCYEVNCERLAVLEEWNRRCGKSEVTFSRVAGALGKSFLVPPGPRSSLPRTGSRVYPWWATMKARHRRRLFLEQHGVGFDHDIDNAKPTLLLQAFDEYVASRRKLHGRWMATTDLSLPLWRRYVADKRGVRQELAAALGCTTEQAKEVLQAVTGGAWYTPKGGALSNWPGVQGNVIYEGLRADLRVMWKVLQEQARDGETGSEFFARLYLGLEDKVMGVIADFLDPGVEAWWVHDGFMTREQVKTRDLEYQVKERTGLKITITTSEL